jgi:hypothetical protein
MDVDIKFKKARSRLMRHPETCLYAGVIMMGETSIDAGVPTAYTDGFNKRYGREFLQGLTVEEVSALDLHENLHVQLMHIPRHRDLMREDARLANAAMDYVVNAVIMNLKDKTLCKLPEGGLYDPKFDGWSVRQVYDFLKNGRDAGKGGHGDPSKGAGDKGQPVRSKSSSGDEQVTVGGETFSIEPMDEHDSSGMDGKTAEDLKKLSEEVEEAARQGSLLAGRFGVNAPRQLVDMLSEKVDWKKELAQYYISTIRGAEELSWRKFNRRRLADDWLTPSSEDEVMGEVVFAVDTSGSISLQDLSAAAEELASLCDLCKPEKVRVLWWDTAVHGEQVFKEDYTGLRKLLKPKGGGGTSVSCVSEYLAKKRINSQCVIVFTDGFVDGLNKWSVNTPTLWIVTQNRSFTCPPNGKVIHTS